MLDRLPMDEQDCVCPAAWRQQLLAIRHSHDTHDMVTWAATERAMTHHTTAREAGELEAQGRELEGP